MLCDELSDEFVGLDSREVELVLMNRTLDGDSCMSFCPDWPKTEYRSGLRLRLPDEVSRAGSHTCQELPYI